MGRFLDDGLTGSVSDHCECINNTVSETRNEPSTAEIDRKLTPVDRKVSRDHDVVIFYCLRRDL